MVKRALRLPAAKSPVKFIHAANKRPSRQCTKKSRAPLAPHHKSSLRNPFTLAFYAMIVGLNTGRYMINDLSKYHAKRQTMATRKKIIERRGQFLPNGTLRNTYDG
jgi:hypothetical protein